MSRRARILQPMPHAQAELYQQILLGEGIEVEIVGGHLPGTFVRLMVPEDQAELAEAALDTLAASDEVVACPSCGESNPETFAGCWSCGASLAGDGTDRKRSADDEPAAPEARSTSAWTWLITALVLLLIFAWSARWFSVSALLE